MGRLLYQWSTAAQLVSVLMIALFYAALARSVKREEVSWWAESWWCNFVALSVTVSYWFFLSTPIVAPLVRAAYVGGKMASVLLLVQGALAMRRAGTRWMTSRSLAVWIAAASIIGGTLLISIDRIGVAVQGVMGVLMLICAVQLLRARDPMTGWLGFGFLLRGLFCVVEAAAYVANSLPPDFLSTENAQLVAVFLGAHSSIDLAGDWLLALGGVVAITRRTQIELMNVNTGMLAAQEQLRNLVDRDPLTGLANRRALADAFRAVFSVGASLVFCDLDEFKRVNDTYGHAAGDECLVRFAAALRASFRPDDTIVRYAGDEFLVVAADMEAGMAQERIEQLRTRLTDSSEGRPAISFSAGFAPLRAGGDAEAAVRAADDAMYAAKPVRV